MPISDNPVYAADDARWSALMVSAQAGHEGDYRQLLQELSEVVNRYLVSRLGSHHFVDDCVQEALIAIHQARHTYDPRRRFRPWLFAIVRHKAIDVLRKQQTQQQTLHNYQADIQDQHSNEFAGGDMAGGLLKALPAQHREAITLTKIVGLSTAEAAARLAISEGALKVRVHRGVTQLRQLMEAEA